MRAGSLVFKFLLVLSLCWSAEMAKAAQEEAAEASSSSESGESWIHFAPQVVTVFPTFAGVGAQFILWHHLELGAQYGLTPGSYSHAIAATAAHLSHNEDYENVINAAFQDNHIVRATAQYDFSGPTGWRIGVAGDWMHASGNASVDDVLKAAASSQDFTALKLALATSGRNYVNMKTDLTMGEAYAGYAWDLWHRLRLSFDLGVLKVINSDIKLDGGTTYEKTPSGSALIQSTESSIESIVKKYGISPTVQFSIDYWF